MLERRTATPQTLPLLFGGESFSRVIARFVLLAAILVALAIRYAQPVARFLLPFIAGEIHALDDTYRIDGVYLDQDGADQVIRIDVGLARPLTLNGRTFYPDPRGHATSSTLVGNVTMPAVLAIAVAMAWPAWSKQTYLWRALALVPAILLLWMIDVPLVLWALIWNLHVQAFDPHRFSPLLIWSHFLHGGGRLALAIVAGAIVGGVNCPQSRGASRTNTTHG
jgi:hypothetical protein